MVWDDEVETDDVDLEAQDVFNPPMTASPQGSVLTMPLPGRTRSQSTSDDFPPPMRRTSTEATRPVPFSAKFQKVHQSVTGVTVLEHLERLDKVEASLQRLGKGMPIEEDEEDGEVDVGVSLTTPMVIPRRTSLDDTPTQSAPTATPPLPSVPEENPAMENSMTEEDLVMMSKSLSHVEGGPQPAHNRWSTIHGRQAEASRSHLAWIQPDETAKQKVIVEVRLILLARLVTFINVMTPADRRSQHKTFLILLVTMDLDHGLGVFTAVEYICTQVFLNIASQLLIT